MRDPLWLLFVFSLQVNSSPKPVSYTRFEGFPYVQKPPVIADQLFGAKLQHKLPTHWSSPKHCNQSQGLKTGDTRQKPDRSECRVRPGLKRPTELKPNISILRLPSACLCFCSPAQHSSYNLAGMLTSPVQENKRSCVRQNQDWGWEE